MPNEETIEQAITLMQGVDLNEFVQLIQDEINKRAFLKALEFVKPDNGVKIWISMDETDSKTGGSSDADIWISGDKPYLEGGIHYSQTSEHRIGVPRFVAQMFGLQPGQCKQFIVTEAQE